MTYDYNARLAQDLADISAQTKAGNLPLEPRRAALDDATSRYALAQAEMYHQRRDDGKKPPIPYRDSSLIDRAANVMLHEDLKWSHPDKMSIVEYPIMSSWQAEVRAEKYTHKPDLQYGDMRFKGRRKIAQDNKYESHNVSSRRVFYADDDGMKPVDSAVIVHEALDNAGLTDKQRQAIELVYFEKMTQDEAALELGVRQVVISRHLAYGIRKLRAYMTK